MPGQNSGASASSSPDAWNVHKASPSQSDVQAWEARCLARHARESLEGDEAPWELITQAAGPARELQPGATPAAPRPKALSPPMQADRTGSGHQADAQTGLTGLARWRAFATTEEALAALAVETAKRIAAPPSNPSALALNRQFLGHGSTASMTAGTFPDSAEQDAAIAEPSLSPRRSPSPQPATVVGRYDALRKEVADRYGLDSTNLSSQQSRTVSQILDEAAYNFARGHARAQRPAESSPVMADPCQHAGSPTDTSDG